MAGLPLIPLVALGLLFFASPLIMLVLVLALLGLRTRVRRLEARLAQLEQRASPSGTASAEARATVVVERQADAPFASPPDREPEPAAVLESAALAPAFEDSAASAQPVARTPEPAVAASPGAPSAPESRPAAEVGQWEGRLGGTWLSRVGAILFFLGVGFFLKHAFEQDWIGPAGRVTIGLVAGLVLMAGGVRLARGATYRVPAQSLVGVGIGILYLSLYAAHGFYALVGAPAAFAGMAVVTAMGVASALWLDAGALAMLATLGGLLTPVILNNPDVDPGPTLFRYLAILDLGVLFVAYRRRWPGLALLAFAGTQALHWDWILRWHETEPLSSAFRWATAFFLIFAIEALVGPEGTITSARLSRTLITLAAPALYFTAARRVLHDPLGRRLAVLAFVLAVGYYAAARVAARGAHGGPHVT